MFVSRSQKVNELIVKAELFFTGSKYVSFVKNDDTEKVQASKPQRQPKIKTDIDWDIYQMNMYGRIVDIGYEYDCADKYANILAYANAGKIPVDVANVFAIMDISGYDEKHVIDAIDAYNALEFLRSRGYDNKNKMLFRVGIISDLFVDHKTGIVKDNIEKIAEEEGFDINEVNEVLALMAEYATYRNEEWLKYKEIENEKEITAVQDIQGFLDFVLKEMKGTATEEERKIIQDQKGDLKKSIEILCAYLSNKNIFNEE